MFLQSRHPRAPADSRSAGRWGDRDREGKDLPYKGGGGGLSEIGRNIRRRGGGGAWGWGLSFSFPVAVPKAGAGWGGDGGV